jgi:hypothetical protein
MDRKQRKALVGGTIIIVLIGLFPPWNYIWTIGSEGIGSVTTTRSAGYHPIWAPPRVEEEEVKRVFDAQYGVFGVQVDTTRLAIQLVVALLAIGGLVLILRPSP